jgi:aspartate/methionine/tyrosine aminotransferase
VDGPTKEDYVWGLRIGFLTFAAAGMTEATGQALAAKAAGAVRGTVSNSSRLSQSLLLRAYRDPEYPAQKRAKYVTLKRRYQRIREILATHPHYADAFMPLPFNSGYFMCVEPRAEPETVRRILLDDFSTGVIATAGVIRIAFSSVPCQLLGELFENLYQACRRAEASGPRA